MMLDRLKLIKFNQYFSYRKKAFEDRNVLASNIHRSIILGTKKTYRLIDLDKMHGVSNLTL